MSLLNKIKKSRENHILKECDPITKSNYLQAIIYFLVIDDKVEDFQIAKLKNLIDLFKMKESEDEFLKSIKNPDLLEEFEGVFDGLKEYGISYLAELFFSFVKDDLNNDEIEFFNLILQNIDVTEAELNLLIEFFEVLKTNSRKDILSICKKIVKYERLTNKLEEFAKGVTLYIPNLELNINC